MAAKMAGSEKAAMAAVAWRQRAVAAKMASAAYNISAMAWQQKHHARQAGVKSNSRGARVRALVMAAAPRA